MALFEGKHYRWMGTDHFHELNDVMHGTIDADGFYGRGGNDTIFAGYGHDVVDGGSGDDIIYAGTSAPTGTGLSAWIGAAAWGSDTVYGGDGNDAIFYMNTTSDVTLYGDRGDGHDGNDTILSGSGNDIIVGGGGHDLIYGGGGNDEIHGDFDFSGARGDDTIYGGLGNDTIDGDEGNDRIWGGKDVDDLTGGNGADIFGFNAGDSGVHYDDADLIRDFDRGQFDRLDLPGHGTLSNFGHIHGLLDTSQDSTEAAAYAHALSFATNVMQKLDIKYEFVTDGQNGWLFTDTDGDHHIDMGIELKGVTDLHYSDII